MALDGFKDIYNDFYGPSDDYETFVKKKEKNVRDRINQLSNEGKAQLSIETEVETMEEAERKPVAVAAKTPGDEKEKPKEPEKSGMEELNELVGLKTVKHDVEELIGLAKVRKMREEKGMKAVPMSLHLVFSGNPGTGKTTVARILGKLYKEICLLQMPFVKDDKVSVGQHVAAVAKEIGAPVSVKGFIRYEKGEGIEKRQDDLAAEVAKMVNG